MEGIIEEVLVTAWKSERNRREDVPVSVAARFDDAHTLLNARAGYLYAPWNTRIADYRPSPALEPLRHRLRPISPRLANTAGRRTEFLTLAAAAAQRD